MQTENRVQTKARKRISKEENIYFDLKIYQFKIDLIITKYLRYH